MSENRKRSRKSKLEVRDEFGEYEVEEVVPVKTISRYKKKKLIAAAPARLNHIRFDHDYCKPGSVAFLPTSFLFELPEIDSIPNTEDKVPCCDQKETTNNIHQKQSNQSIQVEPKDLAKIPEKKNYSKMDSINVATGSKNQGTEIRTCKYELENILHVSKVIAENSPNPADRILDIEMRNLWGSVQQNPEEPDQYEALLQDVLQIWQIWFSEARLIRDTPLFYQCHICNVAWWRLQPFRDHIRTHDIDSLKVILKENIHECFFVACSRQDRSVSNLIYIDIDEDCYRCSKDVDFHRDNCQGYVCNRCNKSFYTCSMLIQHESVCIYSNASKFNVAKNRWCMICKVYVSSLADVDKHLIKAHSVRTDLPVPVIFKKCVTCNSKYFTYSMHNCSKSCKNSSCIYCCRKFATKPLALAHIQAQINTEICCRMCDEVIRSKCLEMEHFLKHSANYELVYKCTICLNQELLFLDENSIKMHRYLWHHKKSDKRRSFFEMMLLPKLCLQEDDYREEAFVPDAVVDSQPSLVSNEQDDFSIQTASQTLTSILTADVSVTVDEIDIKEEPIDGDNGDYEDMLYRMFNEDKDSSPKPNDKPNEEFDYSTVKIKTEKLDDNIIVKTEPADDIDINENPIDDVGDLFIKTEPVDDEMESFKNTEIMKDDELIEVKKELLTVKVEDVDMAVKEDDSHVNVFDGLISELSVKNNKVNKKGRKEGSKSSIKVSPDEMTFNHINTRGLYKKKKVYVCSKCGYTAQHKQYKVHIQSKCFLTPNIDGNYPCTKCGLTFVLFKDYILHFGSHGYKMMSCPKCGEDFISIVKLIAHVHRHIKLNFVGVHVLAKGGVESTRANKELKCQECESQVPSDDMFLHWENHLKLLNDKTKLTGIKEEKDEPELTIDFERVTMNNKELDPIALKVALDHLQSTSSTEKECGICYRAFNRRYDVKRHLVEHLLMDAHMKKSKLRAFLCQICGEDFQRPEKYKFHMRGHASMPIFKCELCNKTFSDSSNFAKHKKTHNVRVLICDLCSKKFHSKLALEKHIMEHGRVRPTKCQFCDKTFPTKQQYKKHKYSVHVKYKFKCVLCDIPFYSLQMKWDHNWEVHKERKQAADCPICLKSFRKFQDVRVHAKAEHKAEVAVLKQKKSRKETIQFFSVRDLDVDNEILVVRQ